MICDLLGMMHAVEGMRKEETSEKKWQSPLAIPVEVRPWVSFRNRVAGMLSALADHIRPQPSGFSRSAHSIK
jgi:hypothetical protein